MKLRNNFLNTYVICNILFIMFVMLLRKFEFAEYRDILYGQVTFLIINVIIILYYLSKRKFKLEKYDIFLLILIVFSGISCIFTKNLDTAIYGNSYRHEGLIAFLYYYSLFEISSFLRKKDQKIILYAILFFGLISVFVAFFEYAEYNKYIWKSDPLQQNHIFGLTTNSNFLSTKLLLCTLCCFSLYVKENKLWQLILYLIFMYFLLLTNCLSGFVGYMCASILFLILNIKKFKKILLIIGITLVTVLVTNSLYISSIGSDTISMFGEVKEISTGNLNESYGTNRVHIWKETIKIVPKNIYFGVGIDNFLNAFGDEPLKSERGRIIDKAHNEYLQILITEGIFTLIAYLIFIISICLKGLKMNSIYLIPVFGYLVQAFFNISVIEVAPLLYILMGFIAKKAKVK